MLLPETLSNVLDAAKKQTTRSQYFNDPVLWAKEVAGVTLWSKQKEIAYQVRDSRNVAVAAGHGVGKLVTGDTPLPTPHGWIIAEEVKEGDILLDEQGNPTSVTGVSPVWDQDRYRITFDDGSTVEAGAKHEWDVLDLRYRTKEIKSGVQDWRDHWDSAKTVETSYIAENLKTSAGQNRWSIPLAKPLQLPEADLPIDPYTFGLWLGDGSAHTGLITVGREEILPDGGYRTNWVWHEDKNAYSVLLYGMMEDLRDLGVLHNKHIPVQYLRSSESQRRALLAGIMDADGFTMTGSMVGIDMTHKRLSEDIYELLMTLGAKVFWREGDAAYTKNGKRVVTGTRYRMNWTPLENPFRDRVTDWKPPTTQRSRHTQRTIVSVEKVGRVRNFCIEVDSPRHLYLAGRQMVPTHNSYLTAILICWWVDTRYPDIFVVSTAPSRAQIGAIVWREIRTVKRRIEQRHRDGLVDHVLPGYITADHEWKTDDGQVFAFGRRPPEQSEGDMVQGIHARYVLAVGDEAVGLTGNMINALQNITSNQYSRRFLIANPTNPNCAFGEIFLDDRIKNSGVWATNQISVLESPNFTDERHELPPEVLASLTGLDYEEDMAREYGVESAQYISRVLGEFARDTEAPYLFTEEDIREALDTEIIPRDDDQVILGVDVARFGKDKSVIYKSQAGRIRHVDSVGGETRVTEIANWVHRHAIDLNASEVRVDGLGIGGGVVDTLLSFQDRKYRLVSMNSSGATPDARRWHNARAHWFDRLKVNMRAGLIDFDIEDPMFDVLKNELLEIQYKYNQTTGGIVIESKDDIRKRGGKSPDFADACVFVAFGAEDYQQDPTPRRQYVYEDPDVYFNNDQTDYYLTLMG